MLIRLMILASVLLSGAAQAADIDSPLKQDIGKSRPRGNRLADRLGDRVNGSVEG